MAEASSDFSIFRIHVRIIQGSGKVTKRTLTTSCLATRALAKCAPFHRQVDALGVQRAGHGLVVVGVELAAGTLSAPLLC